jgi:hypothetical protein
MATARVFQYPGQEIDTSAPPAAWATDTSGGSPPTNGLAVVKRFRGFDAASDEAIGFTLWLPSNYSSGGTLLFRFSSAAATSGNCVWKHAYGISRPGTTDYDGEVYGTVGTTTVATHATAGVEKTVSVDLGVTGAAAGDVLRVFFGRDADNVADTLAGDAEFHAPWQFTFSVV